MRFRLAGITTCTTLALLLSGCNPAEGNLNTNTNSANANTAAESSKANANTNTSARRELTREEYERDKERYQREAREAGRTVGTGLNDGWLWVKARFELAAADDLRDSTINVDVDNAVVTLTGTVASAAQKAMAEQIVKPIEGVSSVKNMLTVSAGENPSPPKK